MRALPPGFLDAPFAHRGLHDRAAGRVENSRAAFRAAMAAGYGIEVDVQLTADGQAVVFHDARLDRLTGETGPVNARTAAELGRIALTDGGETVPTLAEVLHLVNGAVPLLVEVKDQDGALGPDVGRLERAVAEALAGYGGPVAVMSFNPHAIAAMARLAPDIPRGLTTCAFDPDDWSLPADTCARLAEIADYDRTGACFISHEAKDLGRPRVAGLKGQGAAILCWTIRSPEAEAAARRVADQITFEGYAAALP
ncbi:glycerophosphodiester phosphodiesterase family protein [Oceaniglobus roseus]|uniref:glycerophosphodiester phosphodiesterase family protein n=1 Tax=Oceaniglobus roseus TaxID=1737570 RepID=UPI000C7EBADB|nr:glycerophosphodiester phosphodiesterase family protein [Kandeliimicrobium roseum]